MVPIYATDSVSTSSSLPLWNVFDIFIHKWEALSIYWSCFRFYLVACSSFPQGIYIPGFPARVLWSLCHLQFYDISAGLSLRWIWLWSGFVRQTSSTTFLSFLYLAAMEDGQVWMGFCYFCPIKLISYGRHCSQMFRVSYLFDIVTDWPITKLR